MAEIHEKERDAQALQKLQEHKDDAGAHATLFAQRSRNTAGPLPLPDPSTRSDGDLHFALDDNGGTLYQLQGGAWAMVAPRKALLAEALLEANQGGITGVNNRVAIVGLDALLVTYRGNPILLSAYLPLVANDTVNKAAQAKLWDITGGANNMLQIANTLPTPVAGQGQSLPISVPLPARPAGTQRTYKLTVEGTPLSGSTGTVTVFAAPTLPGYMRAVDQ